MSGAGPAPLLGALFALTFVSEDAAVLSAAALVATQTLSWPLGFAVCFLGIWIGDLWLYAMARTLGSPFVARFAAAPVLARGRASFEKRGVLALIASRFVPGTRLPCYLAAGAMRFPLGAFAAVTAAVGALWVTVVFAAGGLVGGQKMPWVLCTALILWAAKEGQRLAAHPMASRLRRHFFHGWLAARPTLARLSQWEFWPAWLFYAPVGLSYAWLALRHRGFSLPTAANPGIPMGGLVGESKFDTLRILQDACPESVAQTWLIEPGIVAERGATLQTIIARENVSLPFILKPDVGQRGVGVKLIRSLESARAYLATVPGPVLLQRYAPGPCEVGVFYYRLPDEPTGHLFAITEKLFPTLEGDGERSVEELILADPRAAMVARTYLRRFTALRATVLPRGATLKLVEAGNHAQGCIFRDGMHLATPELLNALDRISQSVPGFFIGRYDLRYASDDHLRAGRGFTIVELNGAGAEATSIYDARNSLLAAYRTLHRQWALVFRIGALNRTRGYRPASLRTLLREWRRTSALVADYPLAD